MSSTGVAPDCPPLHPAPVPAWKLTPSLSDGGAFWPKALAGEELSPCSPREKPSFKAALTKARCPYSCLCLSLLLQPFPPSNQNSNHSQALLLAALASLPVYPYSWHSASPCLACDLHCTSHFMCHQGQQW